MDWDVAYVRRKGWEGEVLGLSSWVRRSTLVGRETGIFDGKLG